MQRTYLLIVALLVVVLIVAGFEYFSKHFTTQPQSSNTMTTEKTNPSKISSLGGTLNNLLLSHKTEKCTYTTSTDSTTITGTVYVAGNKMKGDFSSGNQDMHITGHMIVNAQNAYVWTDLSKQGFKFSLAEFNASGSGQKNNLQGPYLNQKINYSCDNWSVDNTVFILPTDIIFSPLAIPTTVVSRVSSVTITNTSACSACDSLPASAQRVCRSQLHCQ